MDECSEPKVKSLAKSLKILSCFTIQEPVLGVTELAERIGVTKSNIHNILSTFTSMGYLDRLPDLTLPGIASGAALVLAFGWAVWYLLRAPVPE